MYGYGFPASDLKAAACSPLCPTTKASTSKLCIVWVELRRRPWPYDVLMKCVCACVGHPNKIWLELRRMYIDSSTWICLIW